MSSLPSGTYDARQMLIEVERTGDTLQIANAQRALSDSLYQLADRQAPTSQKKGLLLDAAKYCLSAISLYEKMKQYSLLAATCVRGSAIHAYLALLEEDPNRQETLVKQAKRLSGDAIRAAEETGNCTKIGFAHINAVNIRGMLVELGTGEGRARDIAAIEEQVRCAVMKLWEADQHRQSGLDCMYASRLFSILADAEDDQAKKRDLLAKGRETEMLAFDNLKEAGFQQSSDFTVEEATRKQERISTRTRKHVKRVRPSNFCEGCGEPLPANRLFCASCGRRQQVVGLSFCEGCGKQLEAGSTHCPNCGRKQTEQ